MHHLTCHLIDALRTCDVLDFIVFVYIALNNIRSTW